MMVPMSYWTVRALDIITAAVDTVGMMLEDREIELEKALRDGACPGAKQPRLRDAFLRVYATIDHQRLQLDEEQESELIRILQEAGLYRLTDYSDDYLP